MKKIVWKDKFGKEHFTDEHGVLVMLEMFKGKYYMWDGYFSALYDINNMGHEISTKFEDSKTYKDVMDDYKRKSLSNTGVNTRLDYLVFIRNYRYVDDYFTDFKTETLFRIISREVLNEIGYDSEDLTPELSAVLWKEYYFANYEEEENWGKI